MARKDKRARDYKAEYQTRIAKGLARGLSRREARGHKRKLAPEPTGREIDESTFEAALEEIANQGHSIRTIRTIDIHDEQSFIQKLLDLGYTPREAYTLRFSP